MANDVVRLLTERVNLRIQLVSLVFVILGLGMMFLSLSVGGAGYHKTATLLEESGVAVFISGVLGKVLIFSNSLNPTIYGRVAVPARCRRECLLSHHLSQRSGRLPASIRQAAAEDLKPQHRF